MGIILPKIGEIFLCISDVRMTDNGELVYKKGEFYKSQKNCCITDRAGRTSHYWIDNDSNWSKYFIKWKGHKRKNIDKRVLSLEVSGVTEEEIGKETWNTASDFERIWLKGYNINPLWWWSYEDEEDRVTLRLDLEIIDGIISLMFSGNRVSFLTKFHEDNINHYHNSFDWINHEELENETLKTLLKRYEYKEVH